MISFENFVGCICNGTVISNSPSGEVKFDVKVVLGSGFVVEPELSLILTNYHVLPDDDQKQGEVAFSVIRTNPLNGELLTASWLIDVASIQRWDNHDLIAFRINRRLDPIAFVTHAFDLSQIYLGMQLQVLGLPNNHFKKHPSAKDIAMRCLTGFIVSGNKTEGELSTPFIKGMSGGPVLTSNGKIIGIACENRQVGLEISKEETIEKRDETGPVKTEIYQYRETIRFGVFYQASAFNNWLRNILSNFKTQ